MKFFIEKINKKLIILFLISGGIIFLLFFINEINKTINIFVRHNISPFPIDLIVYSLPFITVVVIPLGVLLGTILTLRFLINNTKSESKTPIQVTNSKVLISIYSFGFLMVIVNFFLLQFTLPWGNQNYMRVYYKMLGGRNSERRTPLVDPRNASITDLIKGIAKAKDDNKIELKRILDRIIIEKNNLKNLEIQYNREPNNELLKQSIANLKFLLDRWKSQLNHFSSETNIRYLKLELHRKIALAFSSFFFAMIAVALGVFFQKNNTVINIVIGIVLSFAILLLYRLIMLLGEIGCSREIINPVLAACIPNLITGITAIIVTYINFKKKKLLYY